MNALPVIVDSDLEHGLRDSFGRRIRYLRISITDRCDFRCLYCMSEDMSFLPRSEVLSLEEIERIARHFVMLGVEKIRITGGEPLIRKGVLDLIGHLSVIEGLRELVLTTNGSHLAAMAPDLKRQGIHRINVSLDTLKPDRFREMTRTGSLDVVLEGIEVARTVGFERIKLNTVLLKNRNDDEILPLVAFAMARDLDLSFIEEMPLGEIHSHDRAEAFMPSHDIRAVIQGQHTLIPSDHHTGGPSRYYQIAGSNSRIGFISPHSQNFCGDCNRVRLTAEGRLLTCLGNEHAKDLRQVVRQRPEALDDAIREAIAHKPERHHFTHDPQPIIFRHMNATGG